MLVLTAFGAYEACVMELVKHKDKTCLIQFNTREKWMQRICYAFTEMKGNQSEIWNGINSIFDKSLIMASITDSVLNVLGIDKVNMDGKLLLIEEQHDSNANFLLSSVISNALKKDYKICFVLFHNTFNHYHSVGMKFGYNLTLLKEKGNVMVIEPMRIIASDMHTIYDQDTTIEHNLFLFIINECKRMTKENERIIIIIDELNHLYNLGFDLKKSLFCIRYLRSLVEYNSTSQLCIVTHTYKHELQDCTLNTFAHVLKHMAHLHVKVEPFETGYTSDASGKLTINWKRDSVRAKYNWAETAKYIYKLLDRQVQIYAPGTAALLA